MTILTEKEREDVYKYWLQSLTLTNEDGLIQLAEKAVLEKLAGMEMPEPIAWLAEYGGDVFTATQLHQAFAQGAASQLSAEPYAWIVNTEMQDGTNRTYPLTGRFKDVLAVCDSGQPVPLYTLKAPK